MSFFDDSHVTDIGLQGSAGPAVGMWDMVKQSYRQQFRVDSARALDDELRNRWLESLRAAQINEGEVADPFDPYAYRAFAQHVQGQPIDVTDPNRSLFGDYDPTARIRGMIDANEAIKKLNNPDIKTFEQILEEVSRMQQGVEEETASMSERGGTTGMIGSLIGAIGGSFTGRDPLNIITAPLGAGRTVATRIASEMGLAAGVVGYTELAEVAPARKIAGLPERDPFFNIAAAAVGAGIIRGGIEGLGYGIGKLRGEDIDFDLRDAQLQQMFDTVDTPTARAGGKALDDMLFIERNNPYGEGQAAHARFMAELQQVQRVMGGEPMTAVARVLPPLPYEYIKKAGDFEIVKEQAPELYARLEAAQAAVQATRELPVERTSDESFEETAELMSRYDAERLPDESREDFVVRMTREETAQPKRFNLEEVSADAERLLNLRTVERRTQDDPTLVPSGVDRRQTNVEYEAAYRDVEAEATRLREKQAAVETAQQREAVSIFADATQGRVFNWSALQHDNVATLVDRINAFNETLDEQALARFTRETVGEGEEAVEREVWNTDDGIDIGLREPVDPEFRFSTDDGDMTIADAMRDLQGDADLDDAMRTCLI